jgi:hypothetical protein
MINTEEKSKRFDDLLTLIKARNDIFAMIVEKQGKLNHIDAEIASLIQSSAEETKHPDPLLLEDHSL